jgi:UDP-N-acetylmuramoyl-tripeptide--D-alanyl-D-alanine ligase
VIPLELDRVAALARGALTRAEGHTVATGVVIDSRRVLPGDLFVGVGAGAAYSDDARARGAAATLLPENAFAALAGIAAEVRDRSSAQFVGITGSTGKTSTKDILAAICAPRARTVAAEASFNNELGVPLTLCRIEPDTEICIVELAMRGLGQIAALADVARPTVGVVTNVGPAHLELVGSLDGVVQAKAELVDALPAGGTAVVPAEFPVRREDLEVVRLEDPQVEVRDGVTAIAFDGREVAFTFRARHQARNALAALHAAKALGIDASGTIEVDFTRWRGDEHPLPGGGVLLNDSWNANPVSMRAALDDLTDRADGSRMVAVLGGMAELGTESAAYHAEIGRAVADSGVSVLVAVGALARGYLETAARTPVTTWVETAAAAIPVARDLIEPGDVALVKGSRSVGLDVVADALARPAV